MTKLKLRPFQQRVFQEVLQGRNVILQAPTGAGKTKAALAPFIDQLAKHVGDPFASLYPLPITCRYAVPLRVLASQFFQDFKSIGQAIDTHWSTQVEQTYAKFDQRLVQIQTGEQPDDPQLESALTFCTIDQLLASFLGIPYGLGTRRANLNVGAVLGSYLVLDEFHLYPLRDGRGSFGARTTALEMLRMLNGGGKRLAPFVLMTATFSSHLLADLANLLDAVIVDVPDTPVRAGEPSELEQLNNGRERRFGVQTGPMRAKMIVERHNGCSLVVCNTVLRAQQMFLDLQQELRQSGQSTELLLLHSRFTDEHRKDKQQRLQTALGKDAWNGDEYYSPDIIAVATQVVEVGLDISVRTLHSEIAPASSIIQRAGRCARFAQQHGQVYLYPLAEGERYAPYDRERSEATLDAFRQFDGQQVSFIEEQHIIDAVHTNEDRALLEAFYKNQGLLHDKIFRGIGQHDRSIASELIRYVQQVPLLVHPNPNGIITERPWDWQSFSLSPYSLRARWDDLQEIAQTVRAFGDEHPIAWEARLDESDIRGSDHDQGERVPARYLWDPLNSRERIASAFIIALSPDIATYDTQLGFRLNDKRLPLPWPDTPFISTKLDRGGKKKSFAPYRQETYAEHIRGLLNAYYHSRLRDELRYIASRLEPVLNLPNGSIDRAVRLAIACHDIGKLGEGWQSWAYAWQEQLTQAFGEIYAPQKAPFAHTDYDWKLHRELERGFKPARPYHACEGAYLAADIIEDIAHDECIARAITAAIARHHAAGSSEYQTIRLIPEAGRYIEEMLDEASGAERWSVDLSSLPEAINRADKLDSDSMTLPRKQIELETWLYFVIVRALRLADGRSFQFAAS